ncbi:MAG: hypothetical protein ABI828_07240 [Actinomycetota bacterium]
MDRQDDKLLARAEEALTEIKVASGLSERHAAVLAALRIRLKGDAGSSLEDLLTAAEDPEEPQLDRLLEQPATKPATTFDDLLHNAEKPKSSLDDLLGSGSDDVERNS